MDETLNPTDKVLLMRDEGEGNGLKVVKGIKKKGKIDAVDPMKAKQSDFLIVDRHADPIENFFRNFMNQAKNPSHTGFYAVTVDMLDKVLKMSDKELEKYRVNPRDYLGKEQEQSSRKEEKQKGKPENKQKDKPEGKPEDKLEDKPEEAVTGKEAKTINTFDRRINFAEFTQSLIPESEYRKYGITPEAIQGEMNAMSRGYKSPRLVDIKPVIDGVEYPMKARLSLEALPDGSNRIVAHPRQNKPDLDKPFIGVLFTEEDKEALLTTGNGGRVFGLEPAPGEKKVPALVSLDRITNRLEAVPVASLGIPLVLKGTQLSEQQQQDLLAGKKVLVEGMTTRKTIGTDNPEKMDAYVQFNVAKGKLELTYDGIDRNRYKQGREQVREANREQPDKVRIPDTLLGVRLDKEQKAALQGDNTAYVRGMLKDGKGQPFNAYVRVNREKGKLDFFRWNPDKARKQGAEVIPAGESRTQVAVNTHGKTNEATKHTKEPLKQGQQKPTEQQQTRQRQAYKKAVKKSTGYKM